MDGAVCVGVDDDPMVPVELSAASAGFRGCCSGPLAVSEFVPGRAASGVLDALISAAASSGIDHAPGTPLVGAVADEASWPTAGLAACGGACAPSPDVIDGFCCAVEAGAVSLGGTACGFTPVCGRAGSSTESGERVGSVAAG
ncbi:hypothetical protein [Nocardia neocaledoniensis]|uniref:hypothetical protein n=1 Tax=Nocardia neocaledoniensis TaxID=236511 RepID=UPI0011B737E0|nr:hypothetical protein [Nocardia neocaledoniensis]